MNIAALQKKAHWVRQEALELQARAGKGHLGGSLSATDLLVSLYYSGLLRTSRAWFGKKDHDRILFSKGHANLSLYVILADLGFFPKSEILKHGKNGALLGGHPDHIIPGCEVSSGSLGHGLGIAAGFALAAKLDKKDYLSIAIMGDGECNEGSVWEAATFGRQQALGQLVAIVDYNGVGATDFTKNYLGADPLGGRWRSFGWEVVEVDGHDFGKITSVLQKLRTRKSDRPLAIMAKTVKGKGVSFMQNDHHWHHGVPKGELLEKARKELGIE